MTTLSTGSHKGQTFHGSTAELSTEDIGELEGYAAAFDAPIPLPQTRDEIHALTARLRDDDDENGLPAGIPPKRYWPDLVAFDQPELRPVPDSEEKRTAWRKLWRVQLWKVNPYCRWCANRVSKNLAVLSPIIPIYRGGADHPLNYTMACPRCSGATSDLTPDEHIQLIQTGFIPQAAGEARIRRQIETTRRIEGGTAVHEVSDADDTEGGAE